MGEDHDRLEQLLELTVYAPVGLYLVAREQFPGLVQRGRGQVTSRVRLARFIGQFAVAKGRQELDKRLSPPPAPPASAPAPPAAPAGPEDEAAAGAPGGDDLEVVVVLDDEPAYGWVLPVDGYDALAASQVLPRLAGLEPADLEQVRRYEVAHRNRRTVLARIAQLQAPGG